MKHLKAVYGQNKIKNIQLRCKYGYHIRSSIKNNKITTVLFFKYLIDQFLFNKYICFLVSKLSDTIKANNRNQTKIYIYPLKKQKSFNSIQQIKL